jgi:hypothetical protein
MRIVVGRGNLQNSCSEPSREGRGGFPTPIMFGVDKGLSLYKEKSAHASNQGSNSNPWSKSPVSFPENNSMKCFYIRALDSKQSGYKY